nr:MAG TPA: hypothetical protein [Caudoviricetes sp.]
MLSLLCLKLPSVTTRSGMSITIYFRLLPSVALNLSFKAF